MPVTADDRIGLGPLAADLLSIEAGQHYMATVDGRCAALAIRAGAFACSVYERRPAVCRELERGTPACKEERQTKRRAAERALTR